MLLRVILTFFVAQLLQVKYVKLAGGLLITWIAIKLLTEGAPEEMEEKDNAKTVWQAVKIIVIADITMALDNMLAVGGASHGNLFLLLFGLGLSIPFIVFTSGLLSMLMDKYPIIVYIGAVILGKVAGEMIITDPLWQLWFLPPTKPIIHITEAIFAAGVIVWGILWMRISRKRKQEEASYPSKK